MEEGVIIISAGNSLDDKLSKKSLGQDWLLWVIASVLAFLPCYLFTVIPAPYFKKYGKHPSIKAFVDGVTAAAIGAIIGVVFVLGKRQITDVVSAVIAVLTILVLVRFKKIQEPIIILIAAVLGLLIKNWL